jgi:hypothetical protein
LNGLLALIRRVILTAFGLACASIARAEMPQGLVDTLARSEMPPEGRAEVEAGRVAVWIFERDTGEEQLSVVAVVKLASSPRRVAEDFFGRPSMLEADIVKASGTLRDPATLDDVAGYHVPESDLEVLADCEVHACKFKLGERGLKDLEAIDWNAPDARDRVDAVVRRRMVDFATAYQKEGRAALGRYVDKPNARSVAQATGTLLAQMRSGGLPQAVRTHLAGYPKSRVPGARDRLYWNVRDFGYRPVTSIVHTVDFDPGAGEPTRLIAAETLYSSHYFYARLQLLGLYADASDPNQTYALYGDRLLFDDKVGRIQRKVLRSSVVADVRDRLGAVRGTYRAP